MKNKKSLLNLSRQILFLILYSLPVTTAIGQSDFLYRLMESNQELNSIIKNSDKHRIQILYTQIDRDQNNEPWFSSHAFRLNDKEYFYPASTIKLFAAVFALEKINDLSIDGLDKDSFLEFARNNADPSADTNNKPVSRDATVANDIKKILVVSDNESFNRLYDFLGQADFNDRLKRNGFKDTRIIHRLSVPLSPEENRLTPGFSMLDRHEKKVIYKENDKYNPVDLSSVNEIFLGESYISKGSLIKEPMSFRYKNVSSIRDLQNGIRKLIFPESFPDEKYNLQSKDLTFLYRFMSQLPRESNSPDYQDKPDNYCKFLMYGADSSVKIPEHIRIFNKIGLAYGFTIDNAYIVDLENKIEFFLTAVIYTNENQVLNDGKYEYDSIAFPFFHELGKVIYDYERKRKKEFVPNLERFNLDYDN